MDGEMGEWGRQEGLQIRSEQDAESQSWKVRNLGWGRLIYRQTNKHKCMHRGIHMYICSRNNEYWKTSVHRNADANTMKKTGYMCKQSQHQSLYERSKSILAVTSFYAIPQHSYTIPTSHLHIKQGSHSHALTNDFWMLLALSLYNCTWDLCSSSS